MMRILVRCRDGGGGIFMYGASVYMTRAGKGEERRGRPGEQAGKAALTATPTYVWQPYISACSRRRAAAFMFFYYVWRCANASVDSGAGCLLSVGDTHSIFISSKLILSCVHS